MFALDARPIAGEPGLRHRLLDVVGELTATLSSAPRLTFSGPVDLLIDGALAADVVAVVREGLSNIARHASASQSSVDVRVTDDLVSVLIDDDGSGVPASPGTPSGTKNLAARAAEHRGTFTMSQRAPRGTSMLWTARLPDAA